MLNAKTLQKGISAVTMFATVVCLSGVSMLAPLTASAATIVDGDIVKTNAVNSDGTPAVSSLDVYIIKTVGTKKFKRLVLNPNIFASYGHLKWENLKTISQTEIDGYTTSSLVRVDGDSKVWALTPVTGGDTGAKSWVNVTAEQFIDEANSDPDSIYTINSTDATAYSSKADITTVTQLKAFYQNGTLPVGAGDGALQVSLASTTPEADNVPNGVGVEFLQFNLTASDKDDVIVNSITLTAGGLGNATKIDSVALYDEDGNRINSTLKDVNSDKEANINVSGFTVKAGTTETITVKAKVEASTESIFNLSVKEAADISSNAASVTGAFPVTGNSLGSVTASGLATLIVDDDGTPSDVNLGDEDVVISKFKITNDNNENATVSRIALKRDSSIADSAADDDFENLALYSGTSKIAEADEITNKYVTFNITEGIVIPKNQTKKFNVKADVIDGAGKDINIALDNAIDVDAMGAVYPSIVTDSFAGSTIDINAGAVTIEKVNAASEKVKPDTDNVEFGTLKITANSGEEVKISTLKLQITAVNDSVAGAAFDKIENFEVYDVTDGIVYDMPYISSTSNTVKIYGNTSIDIYMSSGETHELVVRADTKSTATNQEYTVAVTDASTQVVIKETADETTLSDITPNAVALNKVTVEDASVSFSVNPLSAAKTAVVGTSGVEAINFNIEAGEVSNLKVTELKFANDAADSTLDNTLVSGFSLYENGVSTPIKTVGTSSLASEEVTFSDLEIAIPAGDSVRFYVTLNLVKDSSNSGDTIQMEISGYSAEEDTTTSSDSVYDATNDANLDGVVAAGTLRSARTITAAGVGSLSVTMNNSDTKTDADIYAVAGTATPELAAIKLKAVNEDVKITSISLYSSYASISSVVSKLSLYKSDGTLIKSVNSGIGQTTVFDGLSYVIGQTEQTVYVKADLNLIGKDRIGVLNQTALTWKVLAVAAEGNESGDALNEGDDDSSEESGEIFYDGDESATEETAVSKAMGVLASRISSVELVSSYSGTSLATQIAGTGEYNVAIVKVTTDASDNTLANGDDVKALLSQVKLEINKNAATVLTGVTLQKIGGNGTAIAGTEAGSAFDAGTGLGYITFDTTAAGFGTDEEFAESTTSYYIVKATVGTLEASLGNDWIKIDLDMLNGADGDADSAGANFSWKDSSDAASKFPLRLDGTSSIDGTKINEQS
jgi:hypothetical protein